MIFFFYKPKPSVLKYLFFNRYLSRGMYEVLDCMTEVKVTALPPKSGQDVSLGQTLFRLSRIYLSSFES